MLFDLWYLGYYPSEQTPKRLFIGGGLLILTAITLLIFPQVLVAFLATLLVMGGVSLLAVGWRLKKLNQMPRPYEMGDYF